MARQPTGLTYEDYLHLPADERWELVEGVPHVVPSPNTRHQEILGRQYLVIGSFVRDHGGGRVFFAPFDAVLSNIDVVQPDIVFISDADLDVLTEDNIRGSPTWVIEVLSNRSYEVDKLRRYEAAGVGEHWLIDPYQDTLEVRTLEGLVYGQVLVHTPPARVRPTCLPDLEIALESILAR